MPIHERSGYEYLVVGPEPPNILFFNGFRMHFDSWDGVRSRCSGEMGLLFFNRRGVGKSVRASSDQSGVVVVGAVRSLVLDRNAEAPWIIVAHSLGGLFANLYVRLYPENVRAVLFVESAHPEESADRNLFEPPKLISGLNNGLKSLEKILHPYKFSEDECIQQTVSAILGAPKFPDVPVVVVTGTKRMPFVPMEAHELHQSRQVELLSLSSQSKQVFAKGSGHFPQVTEPEVVHAAIEELVHG